MEYIKIINPEVYERYQVDEDIKSNSCNNGRMGTFTGTVSIDDRNITGEHGGGDYIEFGFILVSKPEFYKRYKARLNELTRKGCIERGGIVSHQGEQISINFLIHADNEAYKRLINKWIQT